MTRYHYRAVSHAGENLKGDIEVASTDQAIRLLLDRGIVPLTVATAETGVRAWLAQDVFERKTASTRDMSLLTRQLATLIGANVPVDRTLAIVLDEALPAPLHRAIADIREKVRGGLSLSDAMAQHRAIFPVFYTSLVRAGEKAGTLGAVLQRLSDYLARSQALATTIRSALIYPTILLCLVGVSIIFILLFVIPQFEPLLLDAGDRLSASARFLLWSKGVLADGWWLIVIFLFAAAVAGNSLRTHERFRPVWHRAILRVTWLGPLIRSLEASRFLHTFATLLASGVSAVIALETARDAVSNNAIRTALEDVQGAMKDGQGFAGPLSRARIFPSMVSHLARLGEEAGRLPDMLLEAAEILDRDIQTDIDRFIALLVPALTLLMGVIVGGMIATVFSTLMSVNELVI